MRIAQVITRADDLGGAQMHVFNLARGFASRGDEVVVFAGQPGVLSDMLQSVGIKFTEIKALKWAINPAGDFTSVLELRKKLKAFNPDVIAVHSSKAALFGRIAGVSLGVPIVFTAHGWSFTEGISPLKSFLFHKIEKAAARLGGDIITVCESDRQLALTKGIASANRISAVKLGIEDLEDPTNIAKQGRRPPKLIMVARFNKQKDQATLLRALSLLTDLKWSLDLVGEGELLDDNKQLANELGIEDRVRFLGFRSDVENLLAQSQVFLLITNYEGFPISILEAMRSGLPVIATNTAGIPEQVEHGRTGYLVRRSDYVQLSEVLWELIKKPQLRVKIGNAGRARYESEFGFERMFDQTLEVYLRATNRR